MKKNRSLGFYGFFAESKKILNDDFISNEI